MIGSCLCGAITYQTRGQMRSVVACHCGQCRKSSGHYVAATQTDTDDLVVQGSDRVIWFASSPTAKRGFCGTCGSPLFWKQDASTRISIMAGSIDGITGLKLDRQIHADQKADYYDLPECLIVDQAAL